MSDEIRAEIKAAAKALCHYPSGPSAVNSCCPGIGRCELEAAVAEIARLRALCDRQSTALSLSGMRHGRILVGLERRNARQRRALAKLCLRRHDKNAEIARLRADLATARREGMEEAAKRLEELHKNHGYDAKTGEVRRRGELITCPLTIDHAIGYYRALAEGVAHILRAAEKEGKP